MKVVQSTARVVLYILMDHVSDFLLISVDVSKPGGHIHHNNIIVMKS